MRSPLQRNGLIRFSWKKAFAAALVPAAAFALLLAPQRALSAGLRVVVLTDAAGLGDKGFNDVCWQGVLRAKADFGLDARFLQSREQADYVANLTLVAKNADVIVTLGYLFIDAVKQVAPHFPAARFIHIEGDVPGENVASYDFRSEEGGFLAGLVAGLFTKKKVAGVVAGMEIPPVEAYVSGFRAGIKTAGQARGEKIEVIVALTGSFNDPVKGKSLALAMIGKGADVIFKAAGNTGVGVIEAVKDKEGVFLIAEDLDQDADLPGKILVSVLKRMDAAVYAALRDCAQGGFKPGHRWLGAPESAIDITEMRYSRQLFDPTSLTRIEKARRLMKEGQIAIPKRHSEVGDFKPPVLD